MAAPDRACECRKFVEKRTGRASTSRLYPNNFRPTRRGTIAGEEATHDLVIEWVLAHQYIRIHEVSRETEANGMPKYEALVFIGWDEPSKQYACLWLDVTGGGGLTGEGIGHAKREGDTLPFLFNVGDVYRIHTTFAYNRSLDSWELNIDNERDGKFKPFARVGLRRK